MSLTREEAKNLALNVTGRLVASGVGGGLLVGALTGVALVYDPGDERGWWAAMALLGGSFGAFAAAVLQLVAAVVVGRAVTRRRPLASVRRTITTLLPVAAAVLTVLVAAVLDPGVSVRLFVAVAVAAGSALLMARLLTPWCLRPLEGVVEEEPSGPGAG